MTKYRINRGFDVRIQVNSPTFWCWKRFSAVWWLLFLHIFLQIFRTDFRAVDRTFRIHGNAFCRAGSGGNFGRIRNECRYHSVFYVSDSNAPFPAVVVLGNGLRFGVGHVNGVMLVDENSARPAELLPLRDVVSVLVEDLNPIVVAISDEKAALRIEGQAMRDVEFARAGSLRSPRLDEFSIFRELHDAVVGIAAVSVGDKYIAIGGDGHSRGHIECVGTIALDARLAESHEHFSIGTEFEDLLAFSIAPVTVGDPDVSIFVHCKPV